MFPGDTRPQSETGGRRGPCQRCLRGHMHPGVALERVARVKTFRKADLEGGRESSGKLGGAIKYGAAGWAAAGVRGELPAATLGRESEDRSPKTEVRSPKSEVRRRSTVRLHPGQASGAPTHKT